MAKQITGETAEKMRAALAAEIERIDAANVNGWQGCARVRLDNGGAVYFTASGEEYRATADSLAFYGRFLVHRVSDGAFVGYLVFDC